MNRPSYGHAFTKWADRHYKSHPEYFGMDEQGKRTLPRDKTRAKLCLTNPAVIEQIIAEWKQAGSQPTVNICPNDGTPGYCRCPDCMKLDARKPGEDFYAHLTDRYLNFWNRFLKRAREEKSDIMAVTYVYSYYRHPPRRERIQYPDNLLCGLVPTLGEDSKALFDAWKKAGMKNSFLRPNDLCYRSQVLRFMEKRIYDKFQSTRKAFKLYGADYDAGAWVPALDLESYTAVRMIAFPGESFDKIQADFCSGFGKAAGAVSDFYNTMRPYGEKMYQSWVSGGKSARYLDDSMVRSSSDKAYMEALGKAINKLVQFPRAGLSPLEQKRLTRLIRNAEHSLLISIFTQEGQLKMSGKANRFESAANDLWHFRLKPGKVLPICWGRAFGAEEKRFWEMSTVYHKNVLKDELNVDDPAAGWVNSFDAPSPQGWRLRSGFEKFTSQEAASGKYSVQSKKTSKEEYVISKHGVPVTPGARYTVSFETKAPAGSLCRLRVRIDGKDLCQIRVISKENSWKKSSATFQVPTDVKSVMIYCCAKAPGGAFIDNVRLKRN